MERRSFLRGMLGVAGTAVAAEGCKTIDKILHPPSPHSRTQEDRGAGPVELSEPHELFSWNTPQPANREQLDALGRLSVTVRVLQGQIREAFRQEDVFEWKECSLVLQEELRQTVLESNLKQDLEEAAETILQTKAVGIYRAALSLCNNCSCQGLLYSAIERASKRLGVTSPVEHTENYYCARVKEYLPTGNDIWSQDIDPRNIPTINAKDRGRLINEPGWSGRFRKSAFRELANNEGIKQLAKDQDLTLAEYFSLLKAVHHEHLNEVWQEPEVIPPTTSEQFAQRLLSERAKFLQRNLLDRTTDALIVLYGRDREGVHAGDEEHHWQDIGRAAGVRQEAIRAFGTTLAHNADEVRNAFFQAIRSSRGKTFIASDSHGSSDRLGVDNERPQAAVVTRALAEVLVERVLETGDAHTLEDVTLCIEACYTYDFAQNLRGNIERLWTHLPHSPFPVGQLKWPTIMTSVQEYSWAIHSAKAMSVLSEQLPGIQKDGALRGKRVLQVVQPLAYTGNDLTYFAPGSGIEFSRREKTSNPTQILS